VGGLLAGDGRGLGRHRGLRAFHTGLAYRDPAVILGSYDQPAVGIPALVVLYATVVSLVVMAVNAVVVARRSGRWW
jgi:hypothetical protein